MAKKKGKKGKGKKDKKKDGLSNTEREIFLLTVTDLEHKIAWRKHQCCIIDEDTKLCKEKLELEKNDKLEAVNLLEEAIEEEKEIFENIQAALPDVESAKILMEERWESELASKVMQMNEEGVLYDAQLEELREKLESLENYSLDNADRKIKDIEKQLESVDSEDAFLKRLDKRRRMEEIFRKEMQDILITEANSFQDEISEKLDKDFERITEETRWWADTVRGLRIATERLEAVNDAKLAILKASQKELKQRKTISLKDSQQLQEGEIIISQVMRRIQEIEGIKRSDEEFQNHLCFLNSVSGSLKQNVDARDDNLMTSFNKIRQNENEINSLEEKLSNEILFGCQMAAFIEKAQQLLIEEAKYSLILTYNGPPKRKKTVEELRCLFEQATKFIYDRKDKSVL